MLNQEFDILMDEFAVPILLNNETKERKAIISHQKQSDSLPNFDEKTISCNFKIKRGDVIKYEGVEYLIISDIQSKRGFKYKATIRPMENEFNLKYMTDGYFEEYDPLGNPIWIEEPEEVIVDLPCIAYQDGSSFLELGGKINIPDDRVKVIMPDDEYANQIELNSEHYLLENYYRVNNIDLFQNGLRIFNMEQIQSSR
ncbi:hypothetical protein [Oceanobacillus sp. J11TS1]|uniref:hypothetical protein n=1 Tax=Oceanobacillus sp. J11TS1 TaxID=2807191 RepID=UPI001B05F214|nr:hypothetical protein [Oceanobacillus sp. J11TS1]GIO22477.1 hypothetical protein J11TS1_10580 [Oceanobacillus sp. J11TS1]